MKFPFKTVFHIVLAFLPGAIGQAASAVEQEIESGHDKKTKAVTIAGEALGALNALAPSLKDHPKFVEAMGKVNDALIQAANIAQQIHDAGQDGGDEPIPDTL